MESSRVKAAGRSAATLRELAEKSAFFGSILSNLELALARSNLELAGEYCQLFGDAAHRVRIFDAIRREWELVHDLVLQVRCGTRLLETQPEIYDAVALGRARAALLNQMQIEQLRRRRGGGPNPQMQSGLHLTISGIAADLRSTG